MNEVDVLKSIAEQLTERKNAAALNNYEVLCNNIKYVNNIFNNGINLLTSLQKRLDEIYKNDEFISDEFKNNSSKYCYFKMIIPRILLNNINIIQKFEYYTKPDDRTNITIKTVGKLKKDFFDYNNLVTSARQFIDSLIVDAYQFTLLDPKEINFQVLTSLDSFSKYATRSILESLFDSNIRTYLKEFRKLNHKKRKGEVSPFTKCNKKTFGEKVDYLFNCLNLTNDNNLKEEIKKLFSFSSEFTHIGYISTFFTSSNALDVVFGDDFGPYLLSTENFNELKYEILVTTIKLFAKIYLPSIKNMLEKSLEQNIFKEYQELIDTIILDITNKLNTRNNEYYFPIIKGLIGSNETINLTCKCNNVTHWSPPHELRNAYCKKCGSRFGFLEFQDNVECILTSEGPVKVIGSKTQNI
ncbi:TPA: hypothetical protein SEN68_001600 [Campylobacter jejuni]|nr:hypothetical protein [Campylobacter jejuni]EAK7766790.1 hypothetical protein [Campylobacter jejuni]EAK8306396.1 hypothetical protein [Campylobacter jejuni]EAK8306553.1 hypothetical protein [Campylobacter jejuni]ECL3824739.1 hypothetical protein [Campylobacter jejuni]